RSVTKNTDGPGAAAGGTSSTDALSPGSPRSVNVAVAGTFVVYSQANVLSSRTVTVSTDAPTSTPTVRPAKLLPPATHPRTPRSSGRSTSAGRFAAGSVLLNSGTAGEPGDVSLPAGR